MRKSIIPQTPTRQKSINRSPASNAVQRKIPSSESPVGKRKPIIVDLKLEYMQNEINKIAKFKQFMEEINHSTKDLINHNDDKKKGGKNVVQDHKRRNSFSLNDNVFKTHLNQSKNAQKKDNTSSLTKQPLTESKSELKKIDLHKLTSIEAHITSKNREINQQIFDLKKKINFSSMWQDKQFFDFTQVNYGIKTAEIEERLEVSEKNLQEKQKQKKTNPEKTLTKQNQSSAYVRFGLYQADTKEGMAVAQYFDVRSKILSELRLINELYVKFEGLKDSSESIKFQLQQTQKEQSNSSEKSSQTDKTHPLIRSVNLFKSQVQKFASIIQAYRAQQSKKKKQQQNTSQNITAFLYHKVRLLNKQILESELSKTKQKISKLKHETELIENGIKELQAFKALTLLRNKHEMEKAEVGKKANSKVPKSTSRGVFDDEILKMILEHQFLTKKLTLRIETKFSGLNKRKIRSISDTSVKRQPNHFRNVKVARNCVSLNCMNFKQSSKSLSMKQKKQQISKQQKKTGIQIVRNFGSKKQIGSSAQTNP